MSIISLAFWLFILFCGSFKAGRVLISNVIIALFSNTFSLDCSHTLDRNETLCPDDDAIYHCSIPSGPLMIWHIASTCGGQGLQIHFSSTSSVGDTRIFTLCSTTLMFTVTSITSSSISVTLTIHTPVLLNGTIISCQSQSQRLILLPSKFVLLF